MCEKSFTTFVRPFNIESSFLLLLKYIAKCGIGYTNPIGSHQFAQYIRRRRILAITLKEVIKTMKQMPHQVNVYFNTKAHIAQFKYALKQKFQVQKYCIVKMWENFMHLPFLNSCFEYYTSFLCKWTNTSYKYFQCMFLRIIIMHY